MADSTGISSGTPRDLSNLDLTKLTPLSPEVISKQATINIGTIGHVAHGKSTVVKALSGVQTVRFKNELERNITIKLGQKEEGGAARGGKKSEEATVHSTVGPEEDEDLQVLAEIQSTMASLNNSPPKQTVTRSPGSRSSDTQLIESPSRPSVIKFSESDSPVRRKIKFEEEPNQPESSSNQNGLPDSLVDSTKVYKKKPGPKSKTCKPNEEEEPEQSKSLPNQNILPNSIVDSVKLVKRKPGPKSKTCKPYMTHSDNDTKEKGGVSKVPTFDNDMVINADDSDDEISTSSQSSVLEKKKANNGDSDDSMEFFEESSRTRSKRLSHVEDLPSRSRTRPKRFSSGSQSLVQAEPKSSRSGREVKATIPSSGVDTGNDSDTTIVPPGPKKRRALNSYPKDPEENSKNIKEDDESSAGPGVKKKTTNKHVDRTYKTKKVSKRKKSKSGSTAAAAVSKDTPSETREIKENGPVDLTVGRQNDGEYEVETVKSSKKIEGRQYYYVKWRGWPDTFNTWEPMENLVHSQEALLEFFQSESKRSLERLSELANAIPELHALTGKLAEYERDIATTLTKDDFNEMDFNISEDSFASVLPSFKLLSSHISKYLKTNNEELELKIKKLIIPREFVRQRYEQLKALAQWEKDIAIKSQETVPLTVENTVDLEGPPDNFHFVTHNIAGEGVEIPDDPPVGCECSDCEDDSSCCGYQSGSKFAYTSEGLLKVEHGTPVYECNKRCKCDSSCPNRVVQNGRTAKLHVFRTSQNIGWGVKVLEDVPQGKFICEYMGEVLKRDVADERMKGEYKGRPLYIFDLDFNDAKEFPYTVDAYQYGNVSHFINHSCEPNLAVYAVWIDCLDPNLPRLAMFAIRPIKAGEELTFDYSAQYHRKRKMQPNNKQQQQRRPGKTPCRCGSGMCRQVLF